MKIIIPLAVNFGPNGGFRVLSQLANNWIEMGHEVDFLVYQDFDSPYFPTVANMVRYDGYGKIVAKALRNKDKVLLGPPQLRWAIKKALNTLSADIVLATQCYSAGPIYKSSIKAKKFYYIQAYEPEFYLEKTLKNLIYKYIAVKSYKYPLKKIVNSEMYFDYEEIKSNMVVYPGMDLSIFYPKKEEFKKKNNYTIGTIGRTEKIKGTYYILEAFKILRKKYGNSISFNVAFGDKELDTIEGVTACKPKNDKELGEFYRSIDIYICAGTFQLDAIHYPVIETMASKTALITTGYYPASNSNASMIKSKSINDIVNAVEDMMANPEVAEDKAKYALSEIKQFEWKVVSKKMLDYFTSN